jgi:hypothetical protein
MTTPTIRELLAERRQPTLSLEFYPPRTPAGFDLLRRSIVERERDRSYKLIKPANRYSPS